VSGATTGPGHPPSLEHRVGPFTLLEIIGRGASGEVWRGVHTHQGVPVAVKVLNPTKGQDPGLLEAFRNEVRAVAGLDHPGIIAVYDHGVLGPDSAEVGAVGSPYLVMELASGGSLKAWCGRVPWEDVYVALMELLEALAHAHARGVIHRDIKPGNVLVGGLRSGVKLTDFGLARLFEGATPGGDDVAGTPAYMAPEQFHGQIRDLGPWTDLYALGCLAWALVSGRPPYGRESPLEARRGHLYRPLPPLEPMIQVPSGLEPWMRRLMEKDPARRFRRAADAAWALASLTGPLLPAAPAGVQEESHSGQITHSHAVLRSTSTLSSSGARRAALADVTMTNGLTGAGRTWTEGGAGALTLTGESLPPELDEETSQLLAIQEALHSSRPPPPQDWRRPEGPLRRASWLGPGAVGLHLFGLRSVPMIGREAERDRLWAQLLEVCRDERPSAVILSGPAGCGKSRLAEWLCERAHEVGAAGVMRALHTPHGGPSHGLSAMLARALRTTGLGPEDVTRRVQMALALQGVSDSVEAAAVAAFILGDSEGAAEGGSPGSVRFSSPAERYALLRRYLVRSTMERPLIVWLDDVAWGLDALRFASALLEADDGDPAPLLLILTAREEALAEQPVEAEQLRQLATLPSVTRLEVGPLDPDSQRELVHALIGLEGELARRVEERTAGNPLFAVQLVGGWVQRELLEPGPAGFQLREGVSVELPADLTAVWQQRIRRVLDQRDDPDRAREALELAATLGQDVDGPEWEAICREAGLEAPWSLVEALVMERLARPAEGGVRGGFSFVHGMLRESLLAEAREAGRLEAHHRRAANALMGSRDRTPWISLVERIGRHLLEGGDPEGALGPLLEAARSRVSGGDYRQAEVLMIERERALQLAGLPQHDRRRGEAEVTWTQALHNQGNFAAAEARARALVEAAAVHGWADLGRRGQFVIAHLTRMRGLYADALAEQSRLEPEARRADDRELLIKILREKGRIWLDQGELHRAAAACQEAYRISVSLSSVELEGVCLRDLSNLHLRSGRHALALQHMKAARARFARSGNRWGIADAYNMLGEVDRDQGRLDRAETRYRESIARFNAIGSFDIIIPQLNLALVLLLQGRYHEVPGILGAALSLARRIQSRNLEALTQSMLLVLVASLREWGRWPEHWEALDAIIQEAGCVEIDLAAALELAGNRAATAGASWAAVAALRLSATCWSALRREGDAERLRSQVARFDSEGAP